MRVLHGRATLLAFLLMLAGFGLVSSGCESNTEGADDYVVTYLVETEVPGAGSAEISIVMYDDELGMQTIELDPDTAGWSESVLMVPGNTIYLRAEGTMEAARMVLQIQVQGNDGSMFARTNNSMPIDTGDFFIEIPREVLP